MALSVAMSATAWVEVSDWYLSLLTYWLRQDRLTHIWMALGVLLGGYNDGHTPCCQCGDRLYYPLCLQQVSSSALSLSQYAIGMIPGVLTQKGSVSFVSEMWNSSPSMFLIRPLKKVRNSFIMDLAVGGLGECAGVAKPLIATVWDLTSGVVDFKRVWITFR